MSIDLVTAVQQFADMINQNPNLSEAEKEQQVQNYAASLEAVSPPPVQNPTVQQVIASQGSPIMGSNSTYQQAVSDQQQYDTSLQADAALAQYLQPGQSFTPLDVNYGGPPTINPAVNGTSQGTNADTSYQFADTNVVNIPPVDSIPVGQSDYLTANPIQTDYPMTDFASEQQLNQSLLNQSPVQLTEQEYVPEWLAPFVKWVQTYNNPNQS